MVQLKLTKAVKSKSKKSRKVNLHRSLKDVKVMHMRTRTQKYCNKGWRCVKFVGKHSTKFCKIPDAVKLKRLHLEMIEKFIIASAGHCRN